MTDGISVADALALRNTDNDGLFGGGGDSWAIILFFLLAWGNGGFGGNRFGNGYDTSMLSGSLTRAELAEGFNFNQLENRVAGLERGICDLGYASLNQTNQLGMQIAENRFAAQQCCCETNRNIDSLRFQSERNTCDITTAIHAEGEATRALINANTMQELRDQLQAAQLQLGNISQTQTLINELRPCPTPAYITCSPYAAYPYGANGCGTAYANNFCGC